VQRALLSSTRHALQANGDKSHTKLTYLLGSHTMLLLVDLCPPIRKAIFSAFIVRSSLLAVETNGKFKCDTKHKKVETC